MIVGIYAEGRGDLAVIMNVLKGKLNLDRSDLRFKLPEYDEDQTDLHSMQEEQYSSWTVVKKTCQEREEIDEFFNNMINQDRFVVIQIDTAERHRDDYDVGEPEKADVKDEKEYCRLVRENVIKKIDDWLGNNYKDNIAYAICIEETDAWVHTIYQNADLDTSTYRRAKEEFHKRLNFLFRPNQRGVFQMKTFFKYSELSWKFRKERKLGTYALKNESLRLFCESLEKFRVEEV